MEYSLPRPLLGRSGQPSYWKHRPGEVGQSENTLEVHDSLVLLEHFPFLYGVSSGSLACWLVDSSVTAGVVRYSNME